MLRYNQVFQGREQRRGAEPSFSQLGREQGRTRSLTPRAQVTFDLTNVGVGVRMSANSHLGSVSCAFTQQTKARRFDHSDREVVATTKKARIVEAGVRGGANVFCFEHVGTTLDPK